MTQSEINKIKTNKKKLGNKPNNHIKKMRKKIETKKNEKNIKDDKWSARKIRRNLCPILINMLFCITTTCFALGGYYLSYLFFTLMRVCDI